MESAGRKKLRIDLGGDLRRDRNPDAWQFHSALMFIAPSLTPGDAWSLPLVQGIGMLLARKRLLEANQGRQRGDGGGGGGGEAGVTRNRDGSTTTRIQSFDQLQSIVRNGRF